MIFDLCSFFFPVEKEKFCYYCSVGCVVHGLYRSGMEFSEPVAADVLVMN